MLLIRVGFTLDSAWDSLLIRARFGLESREIRRGIRGDSRGIRRDSRGIRPYFVISLLSLCSFTKASNAALSKSSALSLINFRAFSN